MSRHSRANSPDVRGQGAMDGEIDERTDEELMKSGSESFKCIQALLKLFMNKQAHEQISVNTFDRDD